MLEQPQQLHLPVVHAGDGTELDGEHFAAHLGPPLEDVLRGYGFDEPMVKRLAAHFRSIYPTVVIDETVALPGAAEALEALRAAGGRTLVVTGKYEPNAALHLKALGWNVDRLAGAVRVYAADSAHMNVFGQRGERLISFQDGSEATSAGRIQLAFHD